MIFRVPNKKAAIYVFIKNNTKKYFIIITIMFQCFGRVCSSKVNIISKYDRY